MLLLAAAAAAAAIIGVVVLLRRRRVDAGATVGDASSDSWESVEPESVGPVPEALVVQGEHVGQQVDPEHARARPTADEKEMLKRTTENADAEAAAKLKSRAQPSGALKHATKRDPTLLKTKLGEPRTKPSRSGPRLKQSHGANGAPKALEGAAAASTPGTVEDETNARTQAATPSRCHIEWRADGNDYRFSAIAYMPGGDESVLQSSPPLEWNGDAPPSQHLPKAGGRITDRETKAIYTYHALVSRLLAEGWLATGIRERWYELELERPSEDAHEAQRQEGRT